MNKKGWTKRWKNVSEWWGKLNSPWTPSLGEYKIYEKFLKKTTNFKDKDRKMLILGATALLRELGYKYGYQITLIDINQEMVKDQTRFLGLKIPKEKVVIGDWLEMDKIFKNQQFDVIAADHSVINVKFKNWPKLYKNIQNLLKPDGSVLWATTVYNHRKHGQVKDLVKSYRPNKSEKDRFIRIYKLFGNPKFHDKNHGFHFGQADKEIGKLAKKKSFSKEQINEMKLNLGNWTSVILQKKKFEDFTKKYFKIIDNQKDKSHHFYKYQQLYLLKHKKSPKRSVSWKTIAEVWPDLKPPLRPSKGEMRIYERYLKQIIKQKKGKLTALLFGLTTEIRDMLAKYGVFVTMIDVNPEMVKVTESLCQQKNRKEKVVIDDWLKFNLNKKFDIILGDHVFGNVEFKKQQRLWRQIKKHLKSDGYLITDVHLRALNKKIGLKQFIEKYRRSKILKKNREEKWYWLYSLVYNNPVFFKRKIKSVLWPSVEELLRQTKKRNIDLSMAEAREIADDVHIDRPCWFMLPMKKEFEKELKKYFTMIDSDINRKHSVYRCYRIYFAKSK